MISQTGKAIVPVGRTASRWALYGSMVSMNTALLFMASYGWYSAMSIMAGISIGAGAGAGVLGLAALIIEANRVSMRPVERDLEQALAMVERGLIDQEDYRKLKDRILERYHPGPISYGRVWSAIALGALVGMALPLFTMASYGFSLHPLLAAAAGAAIGGGVVAASVPYTIEVIRGRLQRPQLPAPENRRLLGR